MTRWPIPLLCHLALGCAIVAGCGGDEIALLVELRTDFVPGVEFSAVRTEISDDSRVTSLPAFLGDDYASRFRRVAELTGVPDGPRSITVSLLAADGSVVVSRRARAEIAGSTALQVVITRACAMISCPEGQTCHAARCVDIECVTGEEPVCPEPDCRAQEDCPRTAIACVTARCVGGACFADADDTRCGPAQYCNPDRGCEDAPDSDAGITPAGDAGADTGGACVTGCSSGTLTTCATDGTATMTSCPLGCSDAEPDRCARFVPSNVPAARIAAARSGVEPASVTISGEEDYNTTTCAPGEVVRQADASEICLRVVGALTVSRGAMLSVTGSRPLVLWALADIAIDGTIDASASAGVPGPGGGGGSVGTMMSGIGRAGIHSATRGSGGGGGGGLCGAGGGGGDGGTSTGGAGGAALLSPWTLSPLAGGHEGGPGGGAGAAGAGGGGIQLSSDGTLTLGTDALLLAGGGGGRAAMRDGGGGGGGSGGAILLEAPVLTLAGIVGATGGGGGSGTAGVLGMGAGLHGADGGWDRAAGGLSFTAGSGPGGRGSGDTALAGEDATDITAIGDGRGGGGGGGSGCILLRAERLSTGSARLSPSAPPGLTSLGVSTE